jgi:predicted ribosome quality control (RQC) complex YloA/Tae2 family protein
MFWNKKEEDSLPDIPMSRNTKISKDLEAENKSLPSFPDSPMDKGFSQSAIKEAVSGEKEIKSTMEMEDDLENLSPSITSTKVVEKDTKDFNSSALYSQTIPVQPSTIKEMDEDANIPTISKPRPKALPKPVSIIAKAPEPFQMPPPRREVEIHPNVQTMPVQMTKQVSKPLNKNENIYLKIDKYESAKRALNSARKELEEIEDILKKIRDTKLREEQELESWEKQLLSAKAFVQEVNDTVFEKL